MIISARHPSYNSVDMTKWRATYDGGTRFKDLYLQQFSKRETTDQLATRRLTTYVPAFAKLNVNRYKNMLYSRMFEVNRHGGDKSYQAAINGHSGGVDLYGSTMNSFIAEEIIPELLVMSRVGIWVDRPQLSDDNILARNRNKAPYCYTYTSENILSWSLSYWDGEYNFLSVLLRDQQYDYRDGLAVGLYDRYRHVWLSQTDGKVHIQFWREAEQNGEQIATRDSDEIVLNLTAIPFVVPSLASSILTDVSDYQIALMNIESSDINYILKGNIPFYIEQYDPMSDNPYQKRNLPNIPGLPIVEDKEFAEGITPQPNREAEAGAIDGRKYPKGTDAPSFIAPSAEPLMASMKKQEQIKNDINLLMDMAIANSVGQHASADSKAQDSQTVDSGLAFIGLELEYAERQVARHWANYLGSKPAEVKYPVKYELKSDATRIKQATDLDAIKMAAPSKTAIKEIGKQIAITVLKDKIPDATIKTILKEIDEAGYATSDPKIIELASEAGLASAQTMSDSLGYNGTVEVPKAKTEHAERLARIAESQQSPPGGVPDKQPIQGNRRRLSKEKKRNVDKEQKREPTSER